MNEPPPLSISLLSFPFFFRWDAFVPLHRLWLGYMSELLGLGVASPSPEEPNRFVSAPALPQPAGTMQAKLIKADFHGSIMTGQSFSLSVCSTLRRDSERVCMGLALGFDCDDDEIVRRSKNAALVGVSGIVVQETENTFKVVTRKNKSKGALMCVYACVLKCLTSSIVTLPSFSDAVLPKQGSVFAFAVPLYSTEPGGGGGKGGADVQQTETVLDGAHIEIELYGNQFCYRAADRAGRKFKHKETIEL